MTRALVCFLAVTLCAFCAQKNETVTSKVKNELTRYYAQHLPSLQILDVQIQSTQNSQIDSFDFVSLDIGRQNSFLRKDGSVVVSVEDSKKTQKKLFLRYRIDGFIAILKARVNIPKDTIVALDSVDFESVKFDWLPAVPIDKAALGKVEAKKLLPMGWSITLQDVQPISLIRKSSSVTAIVREDSLEVAFEAVAQEDGNLGKVITVKNRHGKIFRAKIVSSDKVIVE